MERIFTFSRENEQQKRIKTIRATEKRNELENKFIAALLQNYEWLKNNSSNSIEKYKYIT